MLRIIILSLSIFLPLQVFSIENKFEFIGTDEGLSQGNAECIFQDSKGFMWFGTFNGLNRYDGYNFKVFNLEKNNPNSLSHEHVVQICEDKQGKLWIGTYGGGVSIYNPETNSFYRLESTIINGDTIPLVQISSITVDTDGNIWFADENLGVFVYNSDIEMVKYFINDPKNPESIPKSYYSGIAFGKDGTTWIGVGNGTLCKIFKNSDIVEPLVFEGRIADNDDGITTVFIDKSNKIWIGTTSQGAYMYDPVSDIFTNYRKEDSIYHISSNTVRSFAEDNNNNFLLGTDGGGVNILDRVSGNVSYINYELGNPYSLNTNGVYAVYFDRSENLWVGTYSGGINFQSKYKTKFKNYFPDPSNKNSLSYKNVTAILQDRNGEVWLGTDGGGLNKFNMKTDSFTHYRADPTNPDWLQTDVIIHLMQDNEGDIYISSYNHGLTIFNKEELSFKQFMPDDNNPNSIEGLHPWFSLQDGYGTIWVGMLAVGLDKFDKSTETFTHYRYNPDDPNSLRNPNVKIIYEDMNLDLWIGTEGGGLHKFNREENNFTQYYSIPEDATSLSNDDVRAIYEDIMGRFWIGTGLGLCEMDRSNGTFKTLSTIDGLPGNTINGILEDELGNLWISTDGGLSKFNPDSLTFKNYDKSDGLQGNEFNYTASMLSNNGYFLFGGKNGFNVFFPNDIQDNPNPPPVVLTEIQILNKPYQSLLVREKGKKVERSVSSLKKLKFSHKQNILSFEFAALDFGNSPKNEYKYILEGFDKEWNRTNSSKRYATYTNLPGGDYVFRVIASNGDGVWNNEGLSIDITITPPFWKRGWFIILIILIFIWLIFRYIRNRETQLQEDKEKLEKKIKEGLEEVNKQKAEMEKKDLELQHKIESEKEQNWYTTGMGRVSKVMSNNKDDLFKLSQNIISELVEYIEVSQGAIYLLNDDDDDDHFIELMAAFAPDEDRIEGTRIELGEGQIGACYKEGISIFVKDLPSEYANFSSGLGEATLSHLVVVPLKLNEIVIGVIELLSFEPVPDYRVKFIEKSGETLTSILTALKANEKTKKLLEQQKMQAEELSAQEEELRQNLEEMQATQEELARMKETERVIEEERLEAEREFTEQLKKQNDELKNQQEALKREEYLFNALLNNAREHIYFKDLESKFIRLSTSMTKLFKTKTVDELMGKSDFDYFDKEHAQPAYDGEQEIIKSGKPIIDLVEKEVHKDGTVGWASTSKIPLKDQDGNIVGTFGISTDITKLKNLEMEGKTRNEELQAQEEELRQNLEEMMATQDELIRLKEIDAEKQAALEREEYLFNALLNNANEHIYFKDLESKFLRISYSMVSLFNVKNFSDLIGKSDFDFFDDAHARPAFEDEQNIIKTGVPIIDLVEKNIQKDGSVTWVSTSKMTLKDKDGNIVGTWGISKDITSTKLMEQNIEEAKEKTVLYESVFEQTINTLAGNIVVFDNEGVIFAANESFAISVKKKVEQIKNKKIFALLPNSEEKPLKTNLQVAIVKGSSNWSVKSAKGTQNLKLISVEIDELKNKYFMLMGQ